MTNVSPPTNGSTALDAYRTQVESLKNDPNATAAYKQQMDKWLQEVDAAIKKVASERAPGENINAAQQPKAAAAIVAIQQAQPAAPALVEKSGSATSGGAGPNSIDIKNTSGHEQKYGMLLNGGSTTIPVAEITLKPGGTGTLRYQNGQGGFIAQANSAGAYQPDASRLEFYADANGINNTNISYIVGRNASISLQDDHGKSIGDTKTIAKNAPPGAVTRDAAGNPTIIGWYDGSTETMKAGDAFMQERLGTGGAYLHPDNDGNRAPGTNPMTMANNNSQHFTATFGDA